LTVLVEIRAEFDVVFWSFMADDVNIVLKTMSLV